MTESALGTLANIWTYPVKGLRAVAHARAEIESDGLAGDRRAALFVTTHEHARTGKTYRGKEDERLHLIDEPGAARRAAMEREVELELKAGERYFDARPVSLILDRWIAEIERLMGRELDPLRFRPNFYARASGDVPAEAALVGTRIALGTAIMQVVAPIRRCVTTTYDIATGESDPNVLRAIAQDRENVMGVYCEVERPGAASLGDTVRFVSYPQS